jgi:hypothetical protein
VTEDVDAALAEAEQALADDAARYALTLLEPIIAAPGDAYSDAEWRRIYAIAGQAWVKEDQAELATLLQELVADRTDPRKAYRLGHLLVERGYASMASGILSRAVSAHADDLDLRHEWVASLELQGRYGEAAEALEAAADRAGAPFLTRYLRAFNLIASGRPEPAEAIRAGMDPGDDPRNQFMRHRLDEMLRRQRFVDAARTPRAIELVLSGALLLEDEAVDYREDSWAAIAANLVRLRAVLEAIDRKPARVVSLRSTRQNVVAKATAALLGVGFEQQYAPDDRAGIFVNHDLAAIFPDVAAQLRPRRPGQLYYAHQAAAGAELPVCADVIGVRGNRVISPWDLFSIVDYQRTDLPKGPPTGSDDELAQEIITAAPAATTLADLSPLVDFARRAAAAGVLGLANDTGDRDKLWPRPRPTTTLR